MPRPSRHHPQHATRHDDHHAAATADLVGHAGSRGIVRVGSRRWFLQLGAAGLAGASARSMLTPASIAAATGSHGAVAGDRKAVILFWLSGGPSHIDMWDPKPDAPSEIRGPYSPIATAVPGVQFSEHLPLQAKIMDKLTVIRSMDCSASNHTPITMQAGNELARRTNDGRDGGGYPSMGSIAAKFRGANDPDLPAFVGLADGWKADVYGAGHMGQQYDPIKGKELPGRLALPEGIHVDRLGDRQQLQSQLDRLSDQLAVDRNVERTNDLDRMAYEMVTSDKVRGAFDVSKENDKTRDEYGRESIGEKALLARRLVEAGVTFVLVSGAWGYFDHHGDDVRWGGIEKGLTPLLPRVDRVMYALINDLESRGLLDSTMVMMMGEFGRTPVINNKAGRGHWTNVMSMLVAGGGMQTGQVIGSTDRRGYDIASRPVRPGDLAATTFEHLGINPDKHWIDRKGRPTGIVTEGGRAIGELI
jgi:hypothetical protein